MNASSTLIPHTERTVALLAFEDPGSSPVGELLDAAQRHRTASELNAAILSAQVGQLPLLLCDLTLPW